MRFHFIACVLALLFLAAPAYGGDEVVARVGNEAITRSELKEAVTQTPDLSEDRIMELLIERRLVLVWAAENRVAVSDEEVVQALASIRERNNLSEEQFERALESRGETIGMFKTGLREQLTINKALGRALAERVKINNDELQDLYERTYPRKTVYTVSHILLNVDNEAPADEETRVRKNAEEILAEIKAGSSFDGMALKYSQDPTTAKEGGRLGAFTEGELLPELEKLASDLGPGEVGGPVRTSAGYHILLLESRDQKEPPALDEVRNSLERSLMAQKEESVRTEWLKELKETTYIEVFPDDG